VKKEIGPAAIAAGIVVVLLIVGAGLWALFRPTSQQLSDQEQKAVQTKITDQYQQYYQQKQGSAPNPNAGPMAGTPPAGAPGTGR